MQLKSLVAVAAALIQSPSLGTYMCYMCGHKKIYKKRKEGRKTLLVELLSFFFFFVIVVVVIVAYFLGRSRGIWRFPG